MSGNSFSIWFQFKTLDNTGGLARVLNLFLRFFLFAPWGHISILHTLKIRYLKNVHNNSLSHYYKHMLSFRLKNSTITIYIVTHIPWYHILIHSHIHDCFQVHVWTFYSSEPHYLVNLNKHILHLHLKHSDSVYV